MVLTHSTSVEGRDKSMAVTTVLTPTHITVIAQASPTNTHTMVASMPACPMTVNEIISAFLIEHSVSSMYDSEIFPVLARAWLSLQIEESAEPC